MLRGRHPSTETKPRVPERALRLPAEAPDEQLVTRAREGDERAASELYRRHVGYVFGLSARMLGHRAEAEDIAQEVFAIALERLRTLNDASAFRPWVAQIAVNLVRKRIRRRQLSRLLGIDDSAPDTTLEQLSESTASGETRAELALLDGALAKLPTEHRLAWMLRYVEGEELVAVARICRCSLATAKRRIARAAESVAAHIGVYELVDESEAE
ncbi:MAG TPA: RNA polymerase sigma factor [Polyangiaceae bacterium]|nr:RNA polymerase sigma factor [Polyangiaceae bacterium]